MKILLIASLAVVAISAQTQTDQDKLVTVPQKYVSSEGLTHQVSASSSQWIGIGKEIGIATREGLESVVDVSTKFGGTNVGRFVMFMVAWKIIGRQAVGIVLGIPIWAVGVVLWVYSMKRFFWGVRSLTKVNADKSKEYQTKKYEFQEGEARTACGVAHVMAIVAWSILFTIVVFFS